MGQNRRENCSGKEESRGVGGFGRSPPTSNRLWPDNWVPAVAGTPLARGGGPRESVSRGPGMWPGPPCQARVVGSGQARGRGPGREPAGGVGAPRPVPSKLTGAPTPLPSALLAVGHVLRARERGP